jgi:dipeptide/tripeptide permease
LLSPESASEVFYAGALPRIQRIMQVVGSVLITAGWVRYGWRIGIGLACGCAIAYINFVWLKRVVMAFADRVTQTQTQQSSGGIVARFLVRYLLMAAVAYAIFTVSRASLYGLLAGLFLPVAAIACEAAYELYAALRRGV